MREVISVHVGQAGVQIGNACCKYYALSGARFAKISLEKTNRWVASPCFSFCKLYIQHEADVVIYRRGIVHRRAWSQCKPNIVCGCLHVLICVRSLMVVSKRVHLLRTMMASARFSRRRLPANMYHARCTLTSSPT